jgi:hypothetical protein
MGFKGVIFIIPWRALTVLVFITVGAPPKAKLIGGRGGSPWIVGGGAGTVVVVGGTVEVVGGGTEVLVVVVGAVVGGGTLAYPKLALLPCREVLKLLTPATLAPAPAATRRPTALCTGYLRKTLPRLLTYLLGILSILVKILSSRCTPRLCLGRNHTTGSVTTATDSGDNGSRLACPPSPFWVI